MKQNVMISEVPKCGLNVLHIDSMALESVFKQTPCPSWWEAHIVL